MMPFKRFVWGLLVILVLLLPGLPRKVQGIEFEQVSRAIAHSQGPTELRELEAFLDQFFSQRMPRLHVPGAAFVLVKDGKTFFSKGYGYADLKKKIPVEPARTIFGVGSVSKLLTATAVMQLVEQGKLSLNQDVNQYLQRFQLDKNYAAPVTVANLLTHTSGEDEHFIGTGARTASEILPLEDYVAKRMPPRFIPPGQVISYSNYGMVLAGYLVELVSGVPFAQYIDENILQPLGMAHSSFLQPLPVNLATAQAVGYKYHYHTHQPTPFYFRGVGNAPKPDPDSPGTYEVLPFYYTNDVPSGVLKTTAADMARFMIAHLQNGRYADEQILKEATARAMHQAQFTNYPRLPGWSYGFNERFQNGLRAIEKGGDKPGFTSLLFLLPDQNLGFFVSYNNSHKELREELVNQFLNHYYPVKAQAANPKPVTNLQQRASAFIGSYRYVRYPHRTLEKLGPVLLGFPEPAPELQVTASDDGTLTLGAGQLVPIEPLLFHSTEGFDVAFRESDQKRITYMFVGTDAFEKLNWYETTTFQLGLLGFCVLVFLSAPLLWLFRYLTRRSHNHLHQTPRAIRQVQFLTSLTGGLNLAFLIGLVLVLLLGNLYEFAYRLPPAMAALLCIPILTTSLTGVLLIVTLLLMQNKYWSTWKRLHHFLMMLALIAFVGFLNYWNLLGFRF